MANPTSAFGWQMPTSTDLVTDLPADFEVFGQAVDTSLADLKGGTTGQVLSKATNADMDFTWVTSDDANAIQNAIVDAKGDLIAASAADTPARLAVGNNGETLVADSSATTGLRYNPQNALVNPVINGGMDIWQRGTTQAVTSSSTSFYGADRWQIYRAATGSTVSRQTVSDTTNLPNIQYSMRIQRDSGNTSTANINATQNFETVNSIPFAGKTITLSFYARRGADYSAASNQLLVWLRTGTGTDQNFVSAYTGLADAIGSAANLTTTWQRFAFTGTVPATATELAIQLQHNPIGTAGTNDWAEITGVQIDLGTYTASTAPTFRRAGGTLAGELAACQRYYYLHASGTALSIGNAGYYSASQVNGMVQFPVTMRTSPSLVATSGADYYVADRNGGSDTFNSFIIYRPSTTTAMIYNGSEASGTAGHAALLYTNNASASIAFSSEL